MRTKRLLLLLLILLAAACGQEEDLANQDSIAGWALAPHEARQSAPDPTPVPATEAPTALPPLEAVAAVPEATFEPLPTLPAPGQPLNVIYREDNGVVIPYPSNWEAEDTGEIIEIVDPVYGVILTISSETAQGAGALDGFLEWVLGNGFSGITNLEVIEEREYETPAGASVTLILLNGVKESRKEGLILAFSERGTRALLFVASGPDSAIAARQQTLDEIIAQSDPGQTSLYGFDREDTLVMLGRDVSPESLDPALQTGSAAGYVGLLYRGLVVLSPDMTIVPDLAENWTVSEDGTVYTFTLREDLRFSQGNRLNVDDVIYSWERAADPATESPTAATYLGDILGVKEKLAGEAEEIAGLEKIDERTLQVTLDGPKPYFLAKLAYPTSFVVDKFTVDFEPLDIWAYEPNSSGPYRLSDIAFGEAYQFQHNLFYHTEPEIKNVIYLTRIFGNRLSIFGSGEVDIVSIGTTDANEVRLPSHEYHDSWYTATSMCTSFLQLDNTQAPLDDVNVRRALALAVDKEALIDQVYEGGSIVATTILPPAMPGFSIEYAEEQRATGLFNAEAARAALAASSYGSDLPPIIISAAGFGDSVRDDLDFMITTWQEVLGIDVTVEFIDPGEFNASVEEIGQHMVSYGWCADYPDPENFLDFLYHSESDFNVGNYSNPEVDALLEAARIELDPTNRVLLYREIEALLIDDGAAIPLNHSISDTLVNPRVGNYVLSPMGVSIVPTLSLIAPAEGE